MSFNRTKQFAIPENNDNKVLCTCPQGDWDSIWITNLLNLKKWTVTNEFEEYAHGHLLCLVNCIIYIPGHNETNAWNQERQDEHENIIPDST